MIMVFEENNGKTFNKEKEKKGPWAPSALMGAMWTISTTLYHLPIWMMPSKFGRYLTMLFEKDDNNIIFGPLWAPPLAPFVATCTI